MERVPALKRLQTEQALTESVSIIKEIHGIGINRSLEIRTAGGDEQNSRTMMWFRLHRF